MSEIVEQALERLAQIRTEDGKSERDVRALALEAENLLLDWAAEKPQADLDGLAAYLQGWPT